MIVSLKGITSNMSRPELKEFKKRLKQVEAEKQWDAKIMSKLLMDV